MADSFNTSCKPLANNTHKGDANLGNMGGCNHVCSIIPPHLLRAIATSDDVHPDAQAAAEHTLMQTQVLRDNRLAVLASLAAPSAPAPPQSIIPSDLLETIASSEDVDPETREGAQRSLAVSDELRAQREEHAESLLRRRPVPPPATTKNRLIYTANHGTSLPGTPQRSEGQPPSTDKAINECYDGLGNMYDFIGAIFHRTSIDGKGMDLIGTIHYDKKFNNAFWNGEQMVFGDGDGIIFNSFTSVLDVIGHELAHGITQFTARLEYWEQSGALNESISDCFGSMLKQYHLKQTSEEADWLIGQGLFVDKIHGIALRSMKAPGTAYNIPGVGKDRQPAHMKDFLVTTADAGGVHINSGIPNRAFYLVAYGLGGHSWERAGQIWYATMLDRRLKSIGSDFKLFANLTCEHALNLYDQTVQDVVINAWKTVGVYPENEVE